jgi:hypothetical protein
MSKMIKDKRIDHLFFTSYGILIGVNFCSAVNSFEGGKIGWGILNSLAVLIWIVVSIVKSNYIIKYDA